ncbi:MAG: InlB B-repeat-containing protein, partial [Clostridia bacterium]|nr:InlB B-repeat-containing protein [Clostridia bacterium]
MSVLLFVGLFMGTLSMLLTGASNPTHTGALNTYVPVEFINLKPVEIGLTTYVDDNGVQHRNVTSRTSYSSDSYADYLDVKLQSDESVRYSIKQTKPVQSSTDTTYVSTRTQVNQMIDLQQNPYFMLAWKGSARVNGSINFSFTRGDKTYCIDTKGDSNISNDVIVEVPSSVTEITPSMTAYKNSSFTFYQIYKNRYYNSTDASDNDFPAYTTHADYTIDFYSYLYGYFKAKNWVTDYWPQWSNGDCLRVNYVAHTVVSETVNSPLFSGRYINWNTCGLGRLAMNQYNTLAPRDEALVEYGRYSSQDYYDDSLFSHLGDSHSGEIVYDNLEARSARLDDGTYVLRNVHATRPAVFRWSVNRFVNINEIKAIYLDMKLANIDTDIEMAFAIQGKNLTTNTHTKYTASGYWASLDDLIKNHSEKGSITSHDRYADVTMDLYEDTQQTHDSYQHPADQMIQIREIVLCVPGNGKVTIDKFFLKIENEYAPSTTADTVYPWANSNEIENLPPEGTPATSDTLNPSSGADTSAYNWAATSTPIVENKVDLLSMTDQHIIYDSNGQFTGFETDEVTGYWRTLEGKSYFTSKTSDLVYREFRRRDASVTEPSGTRDSNNCYVEIPVGTTPYLYYSYSMEGGDDKAVGFYFNVANPPASVDSNGTTHHYSHYYIGQSGLALSQCDGSMESTNETVASAHKALCSSASARTGVIDLRSIGYKDSDIVLIDTMRFYVTGTATKVKFDYLFFGSETLDSSVTNTIAKNSGDAFPWSITHEQFKNATLGLNSEFTFANRINLIEDMFDRKKWNLKLIDSYVAARGSTSDSTGVWTTDAAGNKVYFANQLGSDHRYQDGEEYNALGNHFVYNSDGSVTLKANGSSHYYEAGTSFDHMMSFTIDKNSLSSLRYLNYSVNAPQGLRWSILVKEAHNTGHPGVALRTWSDAMMSGDYYGSGSTNAANSSATVGKSYFREMTLNVFQNNWFKNNTHSSANALDNAWAMFTVPGSETSCFDLSLIQRNISWDSIVSITFIAYKDPSLKSEDGQNGVNGEVTFNYLYLTSEPLKSSSWGAACLETGKSYSWGYSGDQGNVNFTGNPISTFHTQENLGWGASSFYQNTNHTTLNFTTYHKSDYTLYYSFTFTDKATGKEAYPKCMVGFFDQSLQYKLRTRTGNRTDGTQVKYGTAQVYDKDVDSLRASYRMQMPESGAVRISDLGLDNLNHIRVYYEEAKYTIHINYMVVAFSSDYADAATPSQPKKLTKLSSKVADFSGNLYKTDIGITKVIDYAGDKNYPNGVSKSITVDLNRTPYLFYSIKYSAGATGTFALQTNAADSATSEGFFRDGTEADQRSKNLLRSGVEPTAAYYMPESETGCIDVRSWLQRQGKLPSDGILNISKFYAYVTGGTAYYYYMYFGAEADKTIDLIPGGAQQDLDNGVSTHSAVYETNKIFELHQAGEKTPDGAPMDSYIDESAAGTASSTKPLMVSYLPGDATDESYQDGYNDLTYSNSTWGYYNLCYGEVQAEGAHGYKYVTTGNNQTSGLTINLNETPYLHFSISQPETSMTTFLLQINDYTGREVLRGLSPEKVKPWLSCYNSNSPAGQLMHISPQTSFITFYKDTVMEYTNGTYVSGDFAGVIDLRRWFTETNGYDDIISLERVRFYTPDPRVAGKSADVTVNHFYLSSSCGSAYSVMFDKNDGSGQTQTIQVLKNANAQFVSDEVPTELGYKSRDGYTFVGWYTDPDWEEYFDIENTPIRENIKLYAGWLRNSDVVDGELDLIARAADDQSLIENQVTVSGTGHWETDDEALHIRNTGSTDYTITIPVNKAYSLYDSHSLYLGMDTAKTMSANVDLNDETRTSDGARIVLDLKSLGSHQYDLLGADFGSYFLTDSNILTAAPYNEQLPMYMHLANKDLLPVKENTEGYVYAKSITVTVPVGAAVHIRYATAAKAMSENTQTVVAPEITGTVYDLLDAKGDAGYVEQILYSTYEVLEEETEIYSRTQAPTSLKQAQITGVNTGYVTLGSLYGLGN